MRTTRPDSPPRICCLKLGPGFPSSRALPPSLPPPYLECLGPEHREEVGEGDADGLPLPGEGVKAVAVRDTVPAGIRADDGLVALTITLRRRRGGVGRGRGKGMSGGSVNHSGTSVNLP